MSHKIPIAIIGATGYTGAELMRLLLTHPRAEVVAITSRQHTGVAFADLYPAFTGVTELKFTKLNFTALAKKIKAAFLCLPHHESMTVAKGLRVRGIKVFDLSADFRIKNVRTYEEWYGKHSQKKLIKEAVYGLPELYRGAIKKAALVAVPGCYPTGALLALAPLLKRGMIAGEGIIIDAKSGTSGAGRTAKLQSLFCEVNESFQAYSVGVHRHSPEIEQVLSDFAGEPVKILFTPHLVPMDRGIFTTAYCRPLQKFSAAEVVEQLRQFYNNEKFIRVLDVGSYPSTKAVRGSNFCHIGVFVDEKTDHLVVLSAIDNLTKGASGQAVQCFNLVFGFAESLGLNNCALIP